MADNQIAHDNEQIAVVARTFDPARLAQARRLCRMSKTELHREVGVSAAAIGQYERGEVSPRPETVRALAKALNVQPGFFALGRPRASIEIAQASFRRLRATTVAQQQQATAYVEQTWELSRYLERFVEFPDIDLPRWDPSRDGEVIDPIRAAQNVREAWGLGDGPIRHVVYELESHGILTVLFSMKEEGEKDGKSRIDAFSTSALPRPTIVLTPDKADDVLRHRFSAAHELGHLILHRGRQGADSNMEREAHAFAAEFLAPRSSIEPLLPRRLNLAHLADVSDQWGVSVDSLVYRSREFDLFSDSTAQRAWMALRSVPRQTQSIWDYAGERPELLANAIALLEGSGKSLVDIATELQMTPSMIRKLATMDSPKPKLSLVERAPNPEVGPSEYDDTREEVNNMPNRSSISGRYISNAAAARHPRTSVRESGANASSSTANRSAISGRYISNAAAARHPNTSITENRK